MDSSGNKGFWEREAFVLSNGLSEGLGGAFSNVWDDLKTAGRKISEHPVSYAGELVSNHWREPLAGAAFALVKGKGIARVGMAVYSLRDVASSTWHAASDASDPKANLEAVAKKYRQSIAEEGSALIEGTPLMLAGGIAGRSLANNLIGRNAGLYDVARGHVRLSEVKQNALDMYDTTRAPKLVVMDMDNTMFAFSKGLAVGVQRAIPELSRKTGFSEEELFGLLRGPMKRGGSFNYTWALEEDLARAMKVGEPGHLTQRAFEREIAQPFYRTLEASQSEFGTPFPDVLPTLNRLHELAVPVYSLTNATSTALPRFASMKLNDGRLVQQLHALVDREAPDPASMPPEFWAAGVARLQAIRETPHGFSKFVQYPRQWAKPDERGLNAIREQEGLRRRQVLMVGDSIRNDVPGVAQRAGTRGARVDYPFTTPEHEAIMDKLAHEVHVTQAPSSEGARPKMTGAQFRSVDDLSGVLDFFKTSRRAQMVAGAVARSLWLRPEVSSVYGGWGLQKIGRDLSNLAAPSDDSIR